MCEYTGDMDITIHATHALEHAGTGDVTWLGDKKYTEQAKNTKASLLITHHTFADSVRGIKNILWVSHPRLAYAKLKQYLYTPPLMETYVHPSAFIADDVHIGDGVYVDVFAVVKSGAVLGKNTRISAHAVLGQGVHVGDNTIIHPHCCIEHSVIGSDCVIGAHTVIGNTGFGFVIDFKSYHHRIPHTGRVIIGDKVHTGASVCIDRGVECDTVIADGVQIDNLVHIAHNCHIGKNTILPGQVGLAGSVVLGKNVVLSGQAGVSEGVHMGDNAMGLMGTTVIKNVDKDKVVSGIPARSHKENLKRDAKINRILSKDKE